MGNVFQKYKYFGKNKRKVLMFFFNEKIQKEVKEFLFIEDKQDLISHTYTNEIMVKEYNLRLWFCHPNYRHLWRHNYFGSQGCVIFYDKESSKNELLTIMKDINLKHTPFLIVINKQSTENLIEFEDIRKEITETFHKDENFKCNYLFLNYQKELDLLGLGFVWLCDEMKSLNN